MSSTLITAVDPKTAPYRPLKALPAAVDVERRADGTILLRCPYAVGPVARDVVAYLHHWSEADPGRAMLGERTPEGPWRRVSYGEMRRMADAIGQGLLDLGLKPGDVLLVLSPNSIEHAAMVLGAMTVGVIAAPVTPAYSLADRSLAKLRHVAGLVKPAAVYAQDAVAYAAALDTVRALGARVITGSAAPGADSDVARLAATTPTAEVVQAYAKVGPATIAKILFTSGSTGRPKAVINTHRMMCANQAMTESVRSAENDPPPITLSWLPWNHTMGGNALFNRNMRLGGTLYLDDGKPLPGEFDRTIANLREVLPTTFSNVPVAFGMLVDALEEDPAFARAFFERLESMSYAAAALPDELWHRLQALAVQATGMRVPFTAGYGSTETAPMITTLYWIAEGAGLIGLPPPGVELKLVPVLDGRYEIRVRGENVTPGYYADPEATAEAFDEEGYYRMGDAARFVDPANPVQGLRFAGRVKEDFKLLTGTWVAVGPLRGAVLEATAPLLQDVVVTGHDRMQLGLLAWPQLAVCRKRMGAPAASPAEVAASPVVREAVAQALARYNAAHPASSTRIARVMLLAEPPSSADGEINEKAYINQAAVLARRADRVQQLYAAEPSSEVIVLPAA